VRRGRRAVSEITPRLADITLRRLPFVGDHVRFPAVTFNYGRDPGDEKFIDWRSPLR